MAAWLGDGNGICCGLWNYAPHMCSLFMEDVLSIRSVQKVKIKLIYRLDAGA